MEPRVDECPLSQARIKTKKFIFCNNLDTLFPDNSKGYAKYGTTLAKDKALYL